MIRRRRPLHFLVTLFLLPTCVFSFSSCHLKVATSSVTQTITGQLWNANRGNTDTGTEVKVRDCLYGELHPVSHLILASFYKEKEEVWKHMFRLAELSRIQKNFPYNDVERHRMLVAELDDSDDIIGFVDVDNRKSTPTIDYPYNPRPIVSDLNVCPTMRRRGIARKMIARCEEICRKDFKADKLYIRVLEDNDAAMQMYTILGYNVIDNPEDPPSVVLLQKDLTEESSEEE